MCGVAGIVDYQSRTDYKTVVESMLRSISYRGPDESGIYCSPHTTL
jgi:asparagine synthetase B (glutamine-hydrolysing)